MENAHFPLDNGISEKKANALGLSHVALGELWARRS